MTPLPLPNPHDGDGTPSGQNPHEAAGPSWPLPLCPHAKTDPSDLSAKVWPPPVASRDDAAAAAQSRHGHWHPREADAGNAQLAQAIVAPAPDRAIGSDRQTVSRDTSASASRDRDDIGQVLHGLRDGRIAGQAVAEFPISDSCPRPGLFRRAVEPSRALSRWRRHT
jgi:hypothetical protein